MSGKLTLAEVHEDLMVWAAAQRDFVAKSPVKQLRVQSKDGEVWAKITATKVEVKLASRPDLGWIAVELPEASS